VVNIGVDLARKIERLHVGIAAVIDEPGLVAIEHRVEAQGEKLVVVNLLNNLLSLVALTEVIQVEQVRKAIIVVVGASHVALLLGDDLSQVFHQESASWDFLHRNQTPHADVL
jgi:DNA segregation ATPase FtsK/SpoIIIE-like protein